MSESINAVMASMMAFLFWVVWQYGWKRCQLDRLRQDLFEIRNQLFDDVAHGRLPLSFESAPYVVLRHDLNTSIRFSHIFGAVGLTVPLFVSKLSSLRTRIDLDNYKSRVEVVLSEVSDEGLRKKLYQYKRQSDWLFLRYLLFTSVGFWTLYVIPLCLDLANAVFNSGSRLLFRVIWKKVTDENFRKPIKAIDFQREELSSESEAMMEMRFARI